MGEFCPGEVRGLGEFCPDEVRGLGEGRPGEVRVLGEFCRGEVRGLGEFCPGEVRVLGEGRPAEVRVLDESRPGEVRVLGEGRPDEVCVAVELGRRKITFLNCEATERIENGSSAEIEIKVTPDSWNGFDYFTLIILGEGTTALAHFNEDSAAYILFFMKCRLVFGEISFIVTRL